MRLDSIVCRRGRDWSRVSAVVGEIGQDCLQEGMELVKSIWSSE